MAKFKKLFSGMMASVFITGVITSSLVVHQNYKVSIKDKTVDAKDFGKEEKFLFLNQQSPFKPIPKLQASENYKSDSKAKNYVPVPSLPYNLRPSIPALSGGGSSQPISSTPNIKMVIFSEKEETNMAVIGNGENEIMIESGQNTQWGKVGKITSTGVYIGNQFYKTIS